MGQVKPASSRSSKTPRRSRQVGLACGAVNLQSGRRYAKRNRRLLPLLWPQGAHRPVLTARFPLQGALQTLPVTGREPDTQRSPQTTPPRELLTPAGTRAVSGGLLVATASGHLRLASLICSALPGRTQRFSWCSEGVDGNSLQIRSPGFWPRISFVTLGKSLPCSGP